MADGQRYLLLLRGINVGGKNGLAMADLRQMLDGLGLGAARTYLQSDNAVVQSKLSAATIASKVEDGLSASFKLDSAVIKVLVLSHEQVEAVFDERPTGFGDTPDRYHSDAIFLIGIGMKEALAVFSPKEGVDSICPGKGVIYSQRLSAMRTKSRLGRIMASPLYLSMTIRSWSTMLKLRALMADDAAA